MDDSRARETAAHAMLSVNLWTLGVLPLSVVSVLFSLGHTVWYAYLVFTGPALLGMGREFLIQYAIGLVGTCIGIAMTLLIPFYVRKVVRDAIAATLRALPEQPPTTDPTGAFYRLRK